MAHQQPTTPAEDPSHPEPWWLLALYALTIVGAIAASAVWPWGFAQ